MTLGVSPARHYQKPLKQWSLNTDKLPTSTRKQYAKSAQYTPTAPQYNQSGNYCTDDVDDGKIGIFSAVGNIVEGAENPLSTV